MVTILVCNKSTFSLPIRETVGAAGWDVYAHITESILLQPMERVLVPTGLFMAIPEGYEAQVRPRSGLAYKYGITVLNAPGTIDADYRGEIKVLLVNLSTQPYTIQPGQRIAQLVFAAVVPIQWQEVAVLPSTERNEQGFGHTGM